MLSTTLHRSAWFARVASGVRSRRAAEVFAIAAALITTAPVAASAQLGRALPDSLTDREFWEFFTTMSEDGGSFVSENFVSNEQKYQTVIPALRRTVRPGGVYLGVGPEQNFTYIANLAPRMAVIVDIRRQNAMAHLMYKALFELSRTRADFVSRLFSRPLTTPRSTSATAAQLFAGVTGAPSSDSAFHANRRAIFDQLTVKHGFHLSLEDRRSITHVYGTFVEAGPAINYGYRSGRLPMAYGSAYATYAQIQTLTNAAGTNMAFLATEENYRAVRAMHRKNLIIPVVGDFAGPKAIRAVGKYLRQRNATVSAFYLSNVEQYLFGGLGTAKRFYENVKTLPVDPTSMFIRSIPPRDGARWTAMRASASSGAWTSSSSGSAAVRVIDSAGVSITMVTIDSAGRSVTRRVDPTSILPGSTIAVLRAHRIREDSILRTRADSTIRGAARDPSRGETVVFLRGPGVPLLRSSPAIRGGTSLASGIASIRTTLEAFANGELTSYTQAIGMTKGEGWR